MPFYIGDYLADTMGLTTLEHGAYLLLIFHYWRSGVALLDDDALLMRITRLSAPEWKRSRATLRGFFRPAVLDGDRVLTHVRIEKELVKAGGKYQRQVDRTEAARLALQAKRDAQRASVTDTVTDTVTAAATRSVTDSVTIIQPQPQPQPQPQSPSETVPEAKASGANGAKPDWWPARDRFGRITSDFTEKTVFDVGKVVLGSSAGGQIVKLRKSKAGLRTILELLLKADETSEPRQWFAKVVRDAENEERPHAPHEIYPESEYRA